MYDIAAFQRHFDVSRETLEKFQIYENLLKKWQKKINLVAPSTLEDVWQRHFADSAQIAKYIKPDQSIADIGSGAGFPGMVLAIMGYNVTCIESDQRKCAFLKNVSRETSAPCDVIISRIEDVDMHADVVTARALAPLKDLIDYAAHFKADQYLFLKGGNLRMEMADTSLTGYKIHDSLIADNSYVLEINVSRET